MSVRDRVTPGFASLALRLQAVVGAPPAWRPTVVDTHRCTGVFIQCRCCRRQHWLSSACLRKARHRVAASELDDTSCLQIRRHATWLRLPGYAQRPRSKLCTQPVLPSAVHAVDLASARSDCVHSRQTVDLHRQHSSAAAGLARIAPELDAAAHKRRPAFVKSIDHTRNTGPRLSFLYCEVSPQASGISIISPAGSCLSLF